MAIDDLNQPSETNKRATALRAGQSITINDIARMAGVSKKSVSRVLNDEAGISDDTRKRIKDIITREGYVPDRRARALAASRSFLVALAYNNSNASYVLDLLKGMQSVAGEKGYEVVMHAVTSKGDDAVNEIRSLMQRSGCDGVLLTPPLSESPAIVGAFADESWSVVRIAGDDVNLPIPQIKYDDRAACLAITNHLLGEGHVELGFVGGPRESGSTRRRLSGFKDACLLNNVSVDEAFIGWGDFTFGSGLDVGRAFLSAPNPPTGIVCCNDEMASGVIHAVREFGLRVPHDVSVTGFDDSPLAKQVWPPLTSVSQPVQAMAVAATKSLISEISSKETKNQSGEYSHSLIVRKSTAPVR